MNSHRLVLLSTIAGLTAFTAGVSRVAAAPQEEQPEADVQNGVQTLTRGPVHEAFAETITYNSQPGIVVPKAPPAPIEEVPPDQKPEGANVEWIPGYWAWDADRSDFIWVSGIWRDVPPGRQWVAGYWTEANGGYRWVPGAWVDVNDREMEYLPEPPATLEAGPDNPAPAPDDVWMPGSWVWVDERYAWRPGYWAPAHADWVWVPAHYACTPHGYIFIDGYWDYPLVQRGVLFAPAYIEPSAYVEAGFVYSPSVVINVSGFLDYLFVRPHDCHYYFGDYFAPEYEAAGFHAWFSFHRRHGYDPIFAHELWEHRHDHDWEHRLVANFEHFREHPETRPPHTLGAGLAAGREALDGRGHALAVPLDRLANTNTGPFRFRPVAKDERRQLAQRGTQMHQFRTARRELENGRVAAGHANPPARPARLRLPHSPIASKPLDQLAHRPPARHEVPRPQPQAPPHQR